jgi:hypothetical protein
MKFLISAVALFASSTLAAKYEAGTICHSNVECEKNCLDKQYTIVNEDGGYVFVCDPGLADPVQWYSMSCRSAETGTVDKAAMEAVCKKVDGEPCGYSCILSGKRSADEENRTKWTGSCGKDSAGFNMHPVIYVEKDERTAKILC